MWKFCLQYATLVVLTCSSSQLTGQVVLNEISSSGEVEIYNMGDATVDMSGWWLYNTPVAQKLDDLPLICGSLNLQSKEIVVVDAPTFFSRSSGELALFSTNSFGNGEALVDYVIWGNRAGFTSEAIAVDSMQWVEGDRAPSFADGQSLHYDRLDNAAASWSAGEPSLCADVDPCLADTTSILFDNGQTSVFICSGNGVGDPLNISIEGNIGQTAQWVVTDEEDNILALPTELPIDLEGAPSGVCLIYHVNAIDTVTSLAVGANLSMLAGCFQISNALSVVRDGIDGGQLTTEDGVDRISICIGEGVVDSIHVNRENIVGDTSVWVVTNSRNIIIALPGPPPYSMEGQGDTLWKIYSVAYNTPVSGLVSGGFLDSLSGSCFSLSNPILVFRNQGIEPTSGGILQTTDGLTDLTFCTSDGMPDTFSVRLEGESGSRMSWVITDSAGTILGIPAGPPFDFDGVAPGVCLLWHLSYGQGIDGLDLGKNVFALSGGCSDLSNPITIRRVGAPAVTLMFADSTRQRIICAGDGVPDPFSVLLSGGGGGDSTWVFTSADSLVIGVPVRPPFDLDRAGPGTCLVWFIGHDGNLGFIPNGTHINEVGGCHALSNPIAIDRMGVDGGMLMTSDSATQVEICSGDGNPDPFGVIIVGERGSTGSFLITDTAGIILARPPGPTFDLDGAGVGECLIYHLRFESIEGLDLGNSIDSLSGCFDLSNPIVVVRDTTDSICSTVSSDDDSRLPEPVKVFPNPSTAEFVLEKQINAELQMTLYDLMGQQILYREWPADQETSRIDLASYPAGTYLLQLRRESAMSTKLLVKM